MSSALSCELGIKVEEERRPYLCLRRSCVSPESQTLTVQRVLGFGLTRDTPFPSPITVLGLRHTRKGDVNA